MQQAKGKLFMVREFNDFSKGGQPVYNRRRNKDKTNRSENKSETEKKPFSAESRKRRAALNNGSDAAQQGLSKKRELRYPEARAVSRDNMQQLSNEAPVRKDKLNKNRRFGKNRERVSETAADIAQDCTRLQKEIELALAELRTTEVSLV